MKKADKKKRVTAALKEGGASKKKFAVPAWISMEKPLEQTWEEFQERLATAIADLEEDDFLIIAEKATNHFVQFAAQGNYGMRLEAVSNTFLAEENQLDPKTCQCLLEMGWNAPTYVPQDGAQEPAEGSSNYYIDISQPVPFREVVALATETLQRIYNVRHPGNLEYGAFNYYGTLIRFPTLKLRRASKH